MIELTVKTLDSKNHSFSVPDDITVRQLKEKIADSVNIPADSQRLIYCGRVLQDDKNLSEYDVNGKVIHLVQRAPPVSNGSGPDRGASSARPSAGGNTRRTPLRLFGPGGNAGNAMYLGAMAFPAEFMDGSGISMQQPLQWVQTRLNLAQNMLRRAALILNRLENHTQESNDSSPENGNSSSEANPDEDVVSNNAPIAAVEIAPAAFLVDNTQISAEAGEPSLEIEIETSTEQQNRESSERETQQPTQGTSDQQPQPDVFVFGSRNDNEGDESNNSRVTRTQALANLLETAADVNNRVRPFMAQYQQLMRDDPAFTDQVAVSTNQCLFTSVSEIMHNLAHAYHALSDIMCDFSQPPPRTLRCRPVVIHHSAVVQTGFPIQVATSFTTGANSSNRGQPNAATARPNGSTASASAPLATTTSSAPTEESAQPQPPQPPQAQPEESPATTQPSASTATPTTQQSASAAVTPPSVTHIGPVSGNGAGFEIFVDVAPGSITIDSVEAAVVTNAPTNTSDANTWQSPPEFVQNLISALAGQFMGATVQQIRFPDQLNTNTSSTGTNTSTAAATTQQSTNGQATAASSNGQTATPSSAQNSQARGNTATHPTTATQTRSTARPHVHHLTPSFRGYRSSNFDPFLPCNSHHIRNNRGRRRERANSLHATNTNVNGNSNSNEPANTRGMPMQASSSISISLSADPIMNLEQQLSRASGSQFPGFPQQIMPIIQALRNASVPTEQSNPQQTINQFLQTMQGGGSNSAATLAQILQSVPGYSYTPGESILTDVFMILAQCLSLLDIIQLGMGRSECLVRARPQLQELVTRRLLNNQPLTISAITQIVDRFNAELRPYYSVFEQTRMREEVDLPASISLYNHSMLPSILNTVMAEDQSTFHRTLIRKCTQYVRQLCALLQYCCLDGVSGLETVLRALVTQMNANVPGVVQEWTMTHSIINFRTFISTLNVPIDDVKRYLVYRMGNPTATSPQPAFTPPLIPPAAEPMDVQESEDELVIQSTPSLTREPPVADVPPTQHINEAIGWQSALPPEWVPIITRDSQRQRRQSSQGPFSDAYLSGMPSKRRKLITSAKPQGNLSQVITESMTTALGAAGMSSGPEVDVIAQRAGQDNTLRTAYREQVRSTLCHNLNSNPDYLPEKYPNTAKYFKKH